MNADASTDNPVLQDRFGRTIDYVRLSVTDRCDFRCVYCMAEDMTFVPRAQVLTLEEMGRLARVLVQLGVKRIRLTGGEPLVRRDVARLVHDIGAIDGLRELNMTTNGAGLPRHAQALKAGGWIGSISAWIPWTRSASAPSRAPAICTRYWRGSRRPAMPASAASS
jgi:cyclic pyranopterin phosphate synthase